MHSLTGIATHYDVLGVAPDAPPDAIRSAYRRVAREVHPDRSPADPAAMASVNEAYRVLADPGRRMIYDRSLRAGTGSAAGSSTAAGRVDDRPFEPGVDTVSADRPTFLSPAGPARLPWKLMAVLAGVGVGAVLLSATRDGADGTEPPDGIIRPGSCVVIEPNSDAREVSCEADSDVGDGTPQAPLVVEVLVPLDATCPSGTVGHRDRLGLGIACVPS